MRLVPAPRAFELGRPAGIAGELLQRRRRRRPVVAGARRRRQRAQAPRADRAASAIWSSTRCAEVGPTPGQQLQQAEAGDAVARILDEAQQRQHVLDVGGVEEFQAAELHEGNVAPGQLDLQRAAVAGGAEQHRLLLQQRAALAVFQHALDDVARLVGLVAHA